MLQIHWSRTDKNAGLGLRKEARGGDERLAVQHPLGSQPLFSRRKTSEPDQQRELPWQCDKHWCSDLPLVLTGSEMGERGRCMQRRSSSQKRDPELNTHWPPTWTAGHQGLPFHWGTCGPSSLSPACTLQEQFPTRLASTFIYYLSSRVM